MGPETDRPPTRIRRTCRSQWPLVAVLLVFTIVTIEVQMVANDVYPGVRRLDLFPFPVPLLMMR